MRIMSYNGGINQMEILPIIFKGRNITRNITTEKIK